MEIGLRLYKIISNWHKRFNPFTNGPLLTAWQIEKLEQHQVKIADKEIDTPCSIQWLPPKHHFQRRLPIPIKAI